MFCVSNKSQGILENKCRYSAYVFEHYSLYAAKPGSESGKEGPIYMR